MKDIVIEVNKLRKVYGDSVAVDNISFDVRKGEIFVLLGPSGSGKTTTLECLEGLRKPDGGSVKLMGLNPNYNYSNLSNLIGIQLQTSGLPMKSINPGFMEIIIPAMIVISMLISTILGLPGPFVKSRDAGIFRSYKINGVPATSIVIIPSLDTMLHTIVIAIVIIPTASLFFKAPLPDKWIAFILVFLLTAFAFTGLGVLIGALSSSSLTTMLWSQLIFIPSMVIGGFLIPSDLLPTGLGKIGILLPSTHALNLFKFYSYNQSIDYNPLWSMLILLSSGILSFGLAIYLFNWDNQNKTRRGNPLFGFFAILPYIIATIFLP